MKRRIERRTFIAGASSAAALALGGCLTDSSERLTADGEIRAMLMHLGWNMWSDIPVDSWASRTDPLELAPICAADHVRTDFAVWRRVTERMAASGCNMILIDLGEACVYPSHPELAVKGSLRPEALRRELDRLRRLGLEPIPKLNFSTTHDIWLKDYSRMVSTSRYYEVCADVIRDVADLFGRPRFMHIGYDEEKPQLQEKYAYSVVRQGELWWHDFAWLVDVVEKAGMRPWIWSDFAWDHREAFFRRMPKGVLQSNWYYGTDFSLVEGTSDKPSDARYVKTYLDLDKAGYEQLPCGSNWASDENFALTVSFARKNISAAGLKGFVMAPWFFPAPHWEARLMRACDIVKSVWRESDK